MVYPGLDASIVKNWLIIHGVYEKIIYYITKFSNFKNLIGKITL
jgi:hypothetical protein